MYAKIENNRIVEWPIVNLSQRFPQISFPEVVGINSLPKGIVFIASAVIPAYNTNTHSIRLKEPALVQGSWIQTYEVLPLSNEEIVERNLTLVNSIRENRNRKLIESDWTQVLDAKVDQVAWAAYRQSLRDITSQAGFPTNIVWPTPPIS